MIHELHDLLNRAGARLRSLRLWTSLALCWLFWATVVYFVARYGAARVDDWPKAWGILLGGAALTALGCWALARRAGRDPRGVARRIEATHPELGAMLLAALEQAPSPRFKRLGYLQAAVVRGAVSHGRQHDWGASTSKGRLILAKTAHLASLAALASACVLLADRTKAHGSASATSPSGADVILGANYEVEVQPGDAEIERGTTLLVIAKFRGPLPPDVDLAVDMSAAKRQADGVDNNTTGGEAGKGDRGDDGDDGPSLRRMTRSLEDPQYVGRVPAVTRDLKYYVEFAGRRSPTYRVTVFEYPELERADAHLKYPAYTKLEDKIVEDVRQVTAVEGTQLTFTFWLNKDVAEGWLVDRDGEIVALTRAEGPDPVYEVSYQLARSQRFKLHLVDHEKRKNKLPPDIVVNVTPNKPPTIKLAKPGRDVRVSPVEELRVAGEVSDDFGIASYGLSYALGGEEPQDLSLANANSQADGAPMGAPMPEGALKKASLEHLIDFEALEAKPDQLVSYFIWVEDVSPDGKPRRTMSDMYFAEVRHFDEIFRQDQQATEQQQREQQQQQGQQGAGQQAEQLAEVQKQIVNATWNVIRRETSTTPTLEFSGDMTAVQVAQQQAIEQLVELGEQVSDDQSQEFVAQAREHMETVLERIGKAADGPDLTALRPALSAEQAAYQSLLKLRAREFNVSRQQAGQQGQSGSTSGANSASQQQLQQLELSADENRYETQSRAASARQENAEQLEQSRQVLNRLRELARRQQDLNERLRELQASLEQAATPKEREELERQLKRLRDQQREILRDTEALDNDLQNSENRQQMQEASGQLSETRSRVQQASQALEEGQVSQALSEGARAEQQFNDLRDDFRRQTADRFTEEMREMRDAAQRLDERQQRLSQNLDDMNAEGRRSLRDAGPREELLQGLQQQQQELGETLERMRDTVTEAEEPEPLLARQLYDAVQQAGQQRTEEALDVARQLTDAGASSEATEAMRQANRGIQQLREQVERAARSVLGDETEALRRADEQLRDLAEALNREIQEGRGGEPGQQQPGQQGDAQDQQGDRQGEQPGERGRQPGGEQNSDQSPSEGQEGQGDQADENPQQGSAQGQRQGRGQQDQRRQRGQRGNQPGEQQRGQNGEQGQEDEQPQQSEGEQPGESPGQGSQGRQGQQGRGQRGQGEPDQNQPPSEGDEEGNNSAEEGEPGDQQGQRGGPPGEGSQRSGGRGGRDAARNGGRENGPGGGGGLERLGDFQNAFDEDRQEYRGPITGDFRQWSEGMRDVENMLDDPNMSAEVARLRDRAEAARVDYVRHSKAPDWSKLHDMIADPLTELRKRIAEEIRRKESPDSLVPIDRDAAPPEFAEEVRLYYQRLGSGE